MVGGIQIGIQPLCGFHSLEYTKGRLGGYTVWDCGIACGSIGGSGGVGR